MFESIFGVSATTIGAVALIVGLLALLIKGGFGATARGIAGWPRLLGLPGDDKTWAMVWIVLGLILGGFGVIYGGATGLFGHATTASVTGASVAGSEVMGTCTLASIAQVDDEKDIVFSADQNDRSHENIAVPTTNGSGIIQANLSCPLRDPTSVKEDQAVTCYLVSDTFRNTASTTDTATYSLVGTSASKSLIAGQSWAYTSYLQDNAGATTSSNQEVTTITYPEGTSSRTLSVRFSLAGATDFAKFAQNNTQVGDVRVYCGAQSTGSQYSGGVQKFRFSVTKMAG